MRKATSMVELVETHNIMLSLNRIKNTNDASWKRALWHAYLMSECEFGWDARKKMREALELP